jgi:hypothetical protein
LPIQNRAEEYVRQLRVSPYPNRSSKLDHSFHIARNIGFSPTKLIAYSSYTSNIHYLWHLKI